MVEEKATNLFYKGKDRISWVDIAKGITILLVIIGHTVKDGFYGSTLRGLIFSFHMPLFFILSCITYKMSKDDIDLKQKIKKAFNHLIIPALITLVILIIWECINDKSLFLNLGYWKGKLYTLLFSSGVNFVFNDMNISAIGIPWFLFALFIGRTLFDFCHLSIRDNKKLCILSILIGMSGIFWGNIQWLPFSLDIALAVQPFFYCGYYLKNCSIEKYTYKKMLIWCVIWLITLYLSFPNYNTWTYLELAVRRYNLFPICYISAIAATIFISKLSFYIGKINILAKPLIFIGKNSLYLLCIHIMDGIFGNLWTIENHQFFTAIKRTLINLLFFIIFMSIRFAILKTKNTINSKKN